jgi:hypothetical protein
VHVAALTAAAAFGINPGSGASARMAMRPVVVGESTIRRSAAVTFSSSGICSCCACVISSSSMTRRPAARSLIA